MAYKLKPLKTTTRIALESFTKTKKSLLFESYENHGVQTWTLGHPILQILDSCRPTFEEFNQVHSQLIITGLFQHSLTASRVVKKLCCSPLLVNHAVKLYDQFEQPDAFICNTILRGLVNMNEPNSALSFYYDRMVAKFVPPNHYTFPVLVKVCADLGCVPEGEKVHTRVVKLGFEFDLFVRNAFIHFYSVCGKIWDARKVFDLSPESDIVTWNSMIDGYVKNKELDAAHYIFDQMPEQDNYSWNSIISGYVAIGDMETAENLFRKMPYKDVVSWNCMVDGYSKIGNVVLARDCFDSMRFRNVVSWNIMLALYVRSKDYNECLRLFDKLVETGDAKPNEATIMSALTACAHLGNLDKGKWLHSYITSNTCIKSDALLSTALLTMYSKCGDLDLAKKVFDEMLDRTLVSWNSMIMGYGIHGHGEEALEVFSDMERSGQMPNDATFVCVLSACTHAGMVLEGWWYFNRMLNVYNIEPKTEHYGCMVDLLGKAGLVKDSEEIIKKIPMEAGPALWGALLSACRTHSNVELGEIVAKRLIELEPNKIGPYVLLSNIYAEEGRWSDVENVRKIMIEKGLEKVVGFSSTVPIKEFSCLSFRECDSLHDKSMVYSMLKDTGSRVKLACGNFSV